MLTAEERQALEARLAQEPALRAELDELRATVQALRMMPAMPLPRSFTIDLAAERKSQPWWMSLRGKLGATGAIAALFVAAWVTLNMMSTSGGSAATYTAALVESPVAGAAERSAAGAVAAATAAPAATTAPAAVPIGTAAPAAAAATQAPAATSAPAATTAPAAAAEAPAATEAPPVVAMQPALTAPAGLAPQVTDTAGSYPIGETMNDSSTGATQPGTTANQAATPLPSTQQSVQAASPEPVAKQGRPVRGAASVSASSSAILLGVIIVIGIAMVVGLLFVSRSRH